MPELPETETMARDLDGMLRGRTVRTVLVTRSDVLREASAEVFAGTLKDLAIERAWRRAKMVVLDMAHAGAHRKTGVNAREAADFTWHIVVQPRFTGGLLVDDGSLPASELKASCISLTLDDGRKLHYRDVRRLGTVSLMSHTRFDEYSAALGPEPLDPAFTAKNLAERFGPSRQLVKVALMDQRKLAGVGNIYAAEALWRSGIDPSRVAGSLSQAEVERLLQVLREVLLESIEARGTSFRDYRDAHGERGGFVSRLAVYGRGGEACLRCGHKLVSTHAIDGRGTVFCAWCQS